MQEKSLLLPVRATQALTSTVPSELQIRRVVNDQHGPGRLAHATKSRFNVRIDYIVRLNVVAAEEAVDAFEFAVIRHHARKADVGRTHRAFGDPLQPSGPTYVA
jgi:hypothetical protein